MDIEIVLANRFKRKPYWVIIDVNLHLSKSLELNGNYNTRRFAIAKTLNTANEKDYNQIQSD